MDNSSTPPNGSSDRNFRRPFRLGRGGRRNPPPTPFNQSSGSSPSPSPANFLTRIALGISPPPRISQPSLRLETDPPNSILITTPPLHTRPMAVNPQSASPLYNGLIPPEIRDQIFQYAVTEYTKSDAASQYPESTNYTRPGYTGKRAVAISLLLTCRKVYLETYHLPAKNKEHVFWHERWPPHQERYTNVAGGQEQVYFERFAPWQLELVKDIHLFTQLYWLEDGSFFRLTQQAFMQGIEKLKITIRRGDWWWNERNAPLGINPQRGNGDAAQMQRDWEAERRGQVIAWRTDGWGCAFGNLAALKELEMEFETSEDKVGELGRIVEKAKTWKFPLKDGKVLSTEGLQSKQWKWRSPLCYWSQRCPYCFGGASCQGKNAPCIEKRRLRGLGLGPECTVVSLRWRVADAAT